MTSQLPQAILPSSASITAGTEVEVAPETETKETLDTPWDVVVLDDPVNLMSYVTHVIRKLFGYSKSKAEELMLEVHQRGRSRVWTGEREKAELYVQQLHSHQLRAILERSDS